MTIGSELKSGKFTIYAQWAAILSVLFLIIFSITNFISVLPFAISFNVDVDYRVVVATNQSGSVIYGCKPSDISVPAARPSSVTVDMIHAPLIWRERIQGGCP